VQQTVLFHWHRASSQGGQAISSFRESGQPRELRQRNSRRERWRVVLTWLDKLYPQGGAERSR